MIGAHIVTNLKDDVLGGKKCIRMSKNNINYAEEKCSRFDRFVTYLMEQTPSTA